MAERKAKKETGKKAGEKRTKTAPKKTVTAAKAVRPKAKLKNSKKGKPLLQKQPLKKLS